MEDVGGLLFSTLVEEGGEEGEREGGGAFGGGVVICLDGDLGAGKTALSRGFVRTATGDEGLRVTSPTYLLSNAYQTSHHE
jgi:tRNA threonylcarbamoyladenosine biosynthesis protein TsaE